MEKLIEMLAGLTDELREWRALGVRLQEDGVEDDYFTLLHPRKRVGGKPGV
jgi:hypothetical protein